jgi:hypothetical protein
VVREGIDPIPRWFGGEYVLEAGRYLDQVEPSDDACQVEDHTVGVRLAGFAAPDEWRAALVDKARSELGWPVPDVTRVDESTAETIRTGTSADGPTPVRPTRAASPGSRGPDHAPV